MNKGRVVLSLLVLCSNLVHAEKSSFISFKELKEITQHSYEQAIQEALAYAPHPYTRWQLKEHAQRAAQDAMNKLTAKYGVSQYRLTPIKWKGILQNPDAAGMTVCHESTKQPQIELNEILFFRNYEEFIHIVIPHEVAHAFLCLGGRFSSEHGPEWEWVMNDLNFINPSKYKHHQLDLTPIEFFEQNFFRTSEPTRTKQFGLR